MFSPEINNPIRYSYPTDKHRHGEQKNTAIDQNLTIWGNINYPRRNHSQREKLEQIIRLKTTNSKVLFFLAPLPTPSWTLLTSVIRESPLSSILNALAGKKQSFSSILSFSPHDSLTLNVAYIEIWMFIFMQNRSSLCGVNPLILTHQSSSLHSGRHPPTHSLGRS